MKSHLRLDKTVFRARNQHEALDLEEVGEFRGVEFAYRDGIALFVCTCEEGA